MLGKYGWEEEKNASLVKYTAGATNPGIFV
jgi:hypothetical protein